MSRPDEPRERSSARLTGPIVLAVVFILAAAIYPFAVDTLKPHESYPYRCLSNLKQVVTATIMYESDYDDHGPRRDLWIDSTLPYSKNEEIYHCLELPVKAPEYFGLAYNSWLDLADFNTVLDPAAMPHVYDSINLARNASDPFTSLPSGPPSTSSRTRRRRLVSFADGHARALGLGAKLWRAP